MARFNHKQRPAEPNTTNLDGGLSFTESPELQLASLALTSFMQDKFYESSAATIKRLEALVRAEPIFAAKCAVYARNDFGMRSVSHAIAGEVAACVRGAEWTTDFFYSVVRRPDDITEILAYYGNKYGKPFPNALRRGLARAFDKFDAYALAKYRGEGKGVKLVDAVNITHPRPTLKNADALKALVRGELKSFDTWERKLTDAGQRAAATNEDVEELKGAAWRELLIEGKLGYFALLRNLRNILMQAPELTDIACNQLVNREAIKRSLVLPFRFITAHKELYTVSGARKVLEAIEEAADIACDNIPRLSGTTLIAVDCSGSMAGRPQEIATMFAAALNRAFDADILLFSDRAAYHNVSRNQSIISAARAMPFAAAGTNFASIFTTATRPYDRIVILSDMQSWMEGGVDGYYRLGSPHAAFKAYKSRFSCSPKVWSFDLSGYGTLEFPERNVYAIAGFHEKIFDVMHTLESDRDALVKRIRAVSFC